MPTLYENFLTGEYSWHNVEDTLWQAQSFTPSVNHNITSVKLRLSREGTPGTVTISIRATDVDGKPTGSDLASGTTDGDTLPGAPTVELREITLGSGAQLSASTKYAIVSRALNATGTNRVRWWKGNLNGGNGYTGGNMLYSTDSGSTWTNSSFTNDDFMFEDWGFPREPTVTTQSTSNIASTTATGNGTIVDLGWTSVTQHGHCWSTSANPTTADSKTTNGAGSVGAFTSSITGLTASTLYHTRAYATNSFGTSYGADVEFTTLSGFIPKVFIM